ncbi:hypothetical protein ElyMa_006543400 [Elysia marginata]|uniref:Potassium channel tetramerisation-type BTB domain-containing protein n=1 Tax=Elysia marginata TaxID=1093978 RepID=A0AAV4IA69_9GAST|nr:hypothetical protein ElyMa_006543400 [Elysia marginata]
MDGAIALALALTCRKRRTSKKKRTKWSRQWFLNRAMFGHSELLKELRDNEPDDHKNFLRMDGDCFNELLEIVEPRIKKKTQYSLCLSRRVSYALSFFCLSLYSLL